MSEDIQQYPNRKGDAVFVITRNGRHQYKYHQEYTNRVGRSDSSGWLPGVTTIASHVGGDNFSMAMNWGLKQVRRSALLRLGIDADSLDSDAFKKAWEAVKDNQFLTSDMEAPKRSGTEAREIGEKLHQDIDSFIKNPNAPQAEDNDLFMLWHRELGSHKWVASEQFLVNTSYGYGGTADAISLEPDGFAIWDWKTKDSGYTIRPSELAQITAYALAMESMDHPLTPVKAFIACVMRDGSGIDITPVDISPVGHNAKLFFIGQDMYHALRNAKGGKE